MTIEITVESMACDGCEQTVVTALENMAGVKHVSADRTAKKVSVEGTADEVTVIEAIEDAGYTPACQA